MVRGLRKEKVWEVFKGLLPASLQFDRVSEHPLDRQTIRKIEERFNVQVSEKTKPGSSSGSIDEVAFVVRTYEANLHNAYKARRYLLREEEDNEVIFDESRNEDLVPNEYAFMENFLE